MKWKRLTTMLVLVLSAVMVAGVAVAQDDPAEPEHHRKYGALWAKGTGAVELDVDVAKLGMYVIGDVTIVGRSDLDVLINDAPLDRLAAPDSDGTVIELTGFEGVIKIRGEDFDVTVEGEVKLHGRGGGSASFRGTGWWRTLHNRGLWPAGDPETDIGF